MAKQRKRTEPRELSADEALTQYGVAGQPFRDAPRLGRDCDGLSLLLGTFTGPEAAARILRHPNLAGRSEDVARHTTVGKLGEMGLVVTHRPTVRNPDHVVVNMPDGAKWTEQVADAFDLCFD